ncbi:MAG: TIM44-related membrane protein TimA [Alphaproteobacteria bacterium]|nr:TIM44-related membrane protein TimA [Alphaproteobacteria bacterium]
MKAIELIFLAALAAIVLFQLYAVLGRRVGRGAEEAARAAPLPIDPAPRAATPRPDAAASPPGVAALKARDPSFDLDRFLSGARSAFQMIVAAYAAGDRASLKPLLAPAVLEAFDQAMTQRENEGRSETVEFLQPVRADFEGADLVDDVVRASVRFIAEIRTRSKGPEGEAVDDRRTAEVWTFERALKSRDPNWLLLHVDLAEV